MKVINLGSMNIDKSYGVDHIVNPKETLDAIEYCERCGGKGLNQSVAIANAGATVYHAGIVGADGNGLLDVLQSSGVHTGLICQKDDMRSGHAIIQIDQDGQNCILIWAGTNGCVTHKYIDQALKKLEQGDILLLQNEVSCIDYAIEIAYQKKASIVFNPSPFNRNIPVKQLEMVDYFILNEVEASAMTGEQSTEMEKILEQLLKRYPNASFVLTAGEAGSYFANRTEVFQQKIYQVPVCDTTGAGDTYCGYFVAGLAKKMDIKENLKRASAAAAISVSRSGASASIPTLREVQEFCDSMYEKM